MKIDVTVNVDELESLLLACSPTRPFFVLGPPGIGKTAVISKFSADVGLPLVALTGTQLAPEDVGGIPKVEDDYAVFKPLKTIARKDPYCLFLDEMNAAEQEVQKSFYSLLMDRRVGEYQMPKGSIVIAAGNRSIDSAITRRMASALINRVTFVELMVDPRRWLSWAREESLHPLVVSYIEERPDALFVDPPKTEEPFSTPRSWHMVSDNLYGVGESDLTDRIVTILAFGALSRHHANDFVTFVKSVKDRFAIHGIIKGEQSWPSDPKDRDRLYFLAQSFRSHLRKFLPDERPSGGSPGDLTYSAKGLLKQLAEIDHEYAQTVIARDAAGRSLPAWFLTEIIRDIPKLVARDNSGPAKE